MKKLIENSSISASVSAMPAGSMITYALALVLAMSFAGALLIPTKAEACGYSYSGCGGYSGGYGSYNYVQYPYQVYNYFPQPYSNNTGGSLFNYNPQPYQIYQYYPQQTSNQSGSWFNYNPQPQQIYVYYNKDNSYLSNYYRRY